MPGKTYNEKGASGKCLSDEQLYRYLEKLLSRAESQTVQEHLDSCSACFDDMVALARNIHTPASEAEKVELARLPKLSPQQQVDKILDYVEAEGSSTSAHEMDEFEKVHEEGTVLPPQSNFWKKLWRPFESWKPLPRYAFALSLVVIGMLATLFTYQIVINNNSGDYYVYDDRLPYEYDTSSLRASSNVFENDSLFQTFVRQFKLGMADYMLRDYHNAVSVLKNLEPTASALKARPDNEKLLPWIRDYYFYLGVSHFALSRSRAGNLSPEVKQQHATESIHWLTLADSLVTVRHLEGSDREAYFLGLVYGFSGRRDAGVIQLMKIESSSRFYQESTGLIHKWSE